MQHLRITSHGDLTSRLQPARSGEIGWRHNTKPTNVAEQGPRRLPSAGGLHSYSMRIYPLFCNKCISRSATLAAVVVSVCPTSPSSVTGRSCPQPPQKPQRVGGSSRCSSPSKHLPFTSLNLYQNLYAKCTTISTPYNCIALAGQTHFSHVYASHPCPLQTEQTSPGLPGRDACRNLSCRRSSPLKHAWCQLTPTG